ncbi:MAG: 3'(2'),5'-bisphosphate nucleotidase CysQ [Robiginitomaculum sp.]|nr:3'(2'),5'-bisphosphate nucleotidase CysQ [Robiginitomaculum sp.]MDQ7078273.1 3'(2'),5'-bisphosphate nucleotidase CysQ [Robiginitomaculum sp.]
MELDEAQKQILRNAMLAAGRVILAVRADGGDHTIKGDGSPVTLADTRAEAILLEALKEAVPNIPVVAEEAAEAGNIPKTAEAFFLVDPLDGTKEFIRGGTDFTVNIGLIKNGVPVFGQIYVPATGRFYEGETGQGAWAADIDCNRYDIFADTEKTPISVRHPDPLSLMAVASRSHRSDETNAWLADHNINDTVSAGSSLKFCLLAEGKADVYPRHGPTMEWDTAAGHAILSAAGGCVENLDGTAFLYGKADQDRPYLNPGFIAYGTKA